MTFSCMVHAATALEPLGVSYHAPYNTHQLRPCYRPFGPYSTPLALADPTAKYPLILGRACR